MTDRQTTAGPLSIDVVSDVVCPWCFIGKRRLDRALASRPDLPVVVHWRPFQLDPTIPAGGMDRQEYMRRKFGDGERIAAMHSRIIEAGAEDGIAFRFDRIARSPNTLDAHRVIRWAQTANAQGTLVERLFTLYFVEGQDIGDHDVLRAAAGDSGLDGDQIAALLASDTDKDAVTEEIATAVRLGVSGVPCFILGGRYALSGAQPAEALVDAIEKTLETLGAEAGK